MRIGLFIGSFDPIHNAHVSAALNAIDRHRLRKLYIVPSEVPVNKQQASLTPVAHRLAMIALAAQNYPKIIPLAESGLRYAAETVGHVLELEPDANSVYMLMGRDTYATLPTWKRLDYLIENVAFLVCNRPGYSLPQYGFIPPHIAHDLNDVYLETNSTAIRDALYSGNTLNGYVLNPGVMNYIQKTGIYRNPDTQL